MTGKRTGVSTAALIVTLLAATAAQRTEPFVPIGVWYERGSQPASGVLRDLQTIRALGFNHIRVPVPWAAAEPARGAYRLEPLDALLTLANQAGIAVIVQLDLDPPRHIERGDAAAVAAFLDAASSVGRRHPSFHRADTNRDPYRLVIDSSGARGGTSVPHALWRLDAMRPAAGDRGWRVDRMHVAQPVDGADLRLWTWTAIARGARAITYEQSAAGSAAAGELAGLVSRNAALFGPMRPRPSQVAILYNPLWDVAPFPASTAAQMATMDFYARMFAANIQADFLHPDAVPAGEASRYSAVFAAAPEMLPRAFVEALGGRLRVDPASLQPDVRVDGGGGLVETRTLESADAILLIALNHGDAPQTVTFTFAPETPEAIWQNMETGASVSFVQRASGLTYRHAFAPRDAMVLMIRTRLR